VPPLPGPFLEDGPPGFVIMEHRLAHLSVMPRLHTENALRSL
jgi:hypothetical protein